MRPRLRRVAGLLEDVVEALTGRPRTTQVPQPSRHASIEEQSSAEELKRRLDATRERLKRGTPPSPD